MARHVGIVACSAEGAALCYRTLCTEAAERMGEHDHPEVSLHTFPLARYVGPIRAGDWQAVAELMLGSARKLAGMGADFAICPDNTIHQAFDRVAAASPIPWLHIAETVGRAARGRGFERLAILGTKYLMTGPVYPQALDRLGVGHVIPEAAEREEIDRIIFEELVYGRFLAASRQYLAGVTRALRDKGCDAVVLGCTEIPLLVGEGEDWPLPTLDSTRLLARAALDEALSE